MPGFDLLVLLSESKVLDFKQLDQVSSVCTIWATASNCELVCLDNHSAAVVVRDINTIGLGLWDRKKLGSHAITRDGRALLHHLKTLPQVSDRGLVVLLSVVLGLVAEAIIKLVCATDIHRVVTVRNITLLDDG